MIINNRIITGLLCIVIALLSFSSCKSKKGLVGSGKESGTELASLLSDKEQLSSLQSQLQISAKGMTVKGDLRIVKDKAIFLSVQAFLGIEVARMRFTPDSIIILDRLNRRYFADSFSRVSGSTGKNLTYSIIQSLFLNQVFYPGKSNLANIRLDDFIKSQESGSRIILTPKRHENIHFLINSSKQLTQTKATGDGGKMSFEWEYSEFSPVSDFVFPNKMSFNLNSEKNSLSGVLAFSRIVCNKPLNTECAIPGRYSKVEISDILKLISTL